jgi:hypothetical protein
VCPEGVSALKQYVYPPQLNWGIASVLFENEEGKLLKWSELKSSPSWWDNININRQLTEYKEPRRLKGYVNVFLNKDCKPHMGRVHPDRSAADNSAKAIKSQGLRMIDTIEIEWVEKT